MCARSQGGSSETLYDSIHLKLYSLPDDCVVYPGHEYNGRSCSTILEEKRFNPRLTKTKEEFVNIMANLNLAYPAKFDASVPANLRCGLVE